MIRKKRNKIQVFGLPRSGTNFLEWTLRNNFLGLNYQDINVRYSYRVEGFPAVGAVKHEFPSLSYSDFAIVIYRDADEWLASLKRFDFTSGSQFRREMLDEYLAVARKLPEERVLIYNHNYVVNHYFDVLEEIAGKFSVELVDDPKQPRNRIATDFGKSLTAEIYDKFR